MSENDLKKQAEKMGLQIGEKVEIYHVIMKNQLTRELKKKYVGVVTALYNHIFMVRQKGGKVESFQYKQFIVTKEIQLLK